MNLTLLPADPNPNGGAFPRGHSGTSDNGGKFVINGVEPGRYRVTANRSGYANGEYGSPSPGRPGTILSLGRAQRMTDVTIKLTPHGVVTGRVVDRDGDPLTSVMVQLMRYRYVNGRKQLTPANGSSTNDLGEYRVYGIAPGRYYVSATYRDFGLFSATSSAGPEEEFAPMYYPGSFDISTAAEITVTAGGQAHVDFALAKTRAVRITGRLINTVAPAALNSSVMLTPRGGMIGPMLTNRSAPVSGQDGKFELRGVLPGSYYLIANTNFDGKSYAARQLIDVAATNIEDVILTISPGVEIQGRVRVEGNSPAPANLQVTLRQREAGIMFSAIPTKALNSDSTFTLQNVGPDNYNFFFPGLPEGYFVKSIRAGDTDVLANGLNLLNGTPSNVEIVLSPDAAEATGIVQNPKTQQPMPGATVVLIPTERNRLDQHKTTTTDQSGSFRIRSITPGEYKAYAWDSIEPGAYFDPDFVKPFESKGETVSAREKSRVNVQLTVIPGEASGGR